MAAVLVALSAAGAFDPMPGPYHYPSTSGRFSWFSGPQQRRRYPGAPGGRYTVHDERHTVYNPQNCTYEYVDE